jgi:hypothetical protein
MVTSGTSPIVRGSAAKLWEAGIVHARSEMITHESPTVSVTADQQGWHDICVVLLSSSTQ